VADDGDDSWMGEETYHPFVAYAQSKTANVLFSFGLAGRLQQKKVQSFSVHPGGKSMQLHPSFNRDLIPH